MDTKIEKLLLSKLRRPVHIYYIQNYILRMSLPETISIINELIENDIVEESKYAKEYYVLKNIKNEDKN